MLARREHSAVELKRKLLASVAEEEENESRLAEVDAVIEDFKKRGWLSEERFTEQLLHARKRKFGSLKIAHELRENGITEDLVMEALSEVKTDEFANALDICRKKYKTPPKGREEWIKQARFLQSRGFDFEVIKKVLNQDIEELE